VSNARILPPLSLRGDPGPSHATWARAIDGVAQTEGDAGLNDEEGRVRE